MKAPLPKNLISTREASEFSGYNADHLARLARSGDVVGTRVGRAWLIDRESLAEFMARNGRKAEPLAGFISTREAGKRSGYTSDYLAKLARSGEVEGTQIGRAWLVERRSLERFLKAQDERKEARTRALARAREKEYRTKNAVPALPSEIVQPLPRVRTEIRIPTAQPIAAPVSPAEVRLAPRPRYANALAFAVALLVITGAVGVQASFGSLKQTAGELALDMSAGFRAGFGPSFETVAARIAAALPASSPRETNRNLGYRLAAPELALNVPAVPESEALVAPAASVHKLAVSNLDLGSMLSSARDALRGTPLALGSSVIALAHGSISFETSLAYWTAATAPAVSRTTVLALGNMGDALERHTAVVPHTVSSSFLALTSIPANVAPAIASLVFNLEYQAALAFNSVTTSFASSATHLAVDFLNSTGSTLSSAGPALASMGTLPDTLQNAYLKLLGEGALALSSFTKSTMSSVQLPQVAELAAAVTPTLNLGEQAALATYQTIQSLIDTTSNALAYLIGPAPTVVMPNINTRPIVATNTATTTQTIATSTPSKPAPVIAYNPAPAYGAPTYNNTTVIQGVSQSYVDQSLAALRNNLLATMGQLITPIANQTATNVTTIQQVNMIQDLSNLTVRNGNFLGGTFDHGNLTNGISVSADTGSFSNLTGGATTLGDTTVNGINVVSGGITSFTNATAPYFTATSTSATSTFAGGLAVNTNKLLVDSTTGNVGLGTSTPVDQLDVNGTVGVNGNLVASGFVDLNRAGVGGAVDPSIALAVRLPSAITGATATGISSIWSLPSSGAAGGSLFNGEYSRIDVPDVPSSFAQMYNYLIGTTARGASATINGWSGLAIQDQTNINGTGTTSAIDLQLTSGPRKYNLYAEGTANNYLAGNLGLATTSPAQLLSVAGNGYVTGGLGIGIATTTPGSIQTSGDVAVGGNLYVNGNSTVIGQSTTNSLVINSSIKSNIIPDQNVTYDLGSTSFFWRNAYVGTLTANNISAASTTIGGTQSATFTLNSDNASADTEDASLLFFRGTVVPNAMLTWNSAANAKRFELNQPLYLSNASASTTNPTLTLMAVAGQTGDILDIASSSGANLFNVTGAGRVGIGTSAPAGALDITHTNTTVGLVFHDASNNNNRTAQIGTLSGSGRLFLDDPNGNANINLIGGGSAGSFNYFNAGNVGFGTTSPYSLVSISNAATTAANTPLFTIASTTAGTSTSTLMTVLASGNVGIGTANPQTTLDVLGAASTTRLLVQNGSAGAPSLAFSAATNMGFYRNGNNLVVSVGGSDQVGFSSAPAVNLPSAGIFGFSASAAVTSRDSGLSRLSAGVIGVGNGNAADTSGTLIANTIGIGTTTPWAQLSVNPNGISGPAFVIGSSTATNFVVTNGGNVGIGTAAPGSLLDLKSGNNSTFARILDGGNNVDATLSTLGQAGIFTVNYASNGGNITLNGGSFGGSAGFAISQSGTTKVSINGSGTNYINSGNVGIGTTTPVGLLTVGTGNSVITLNPSDVATGAWIRNDGLNTVFSTNVGDLYYGYAGRSGIIQHFFSGTNRTTVDTLTLSGGKVGIGTAAGATFLGALEVAGTTFVGLHTDGGVNNTANVSVLNGILNVSSPTALNTGTTSSETALRLIRSGTAAAKFNGIADFNLGSYASSINSQTQLDIKLGNGATNNTDTTVLSLLGNGNVGIGTTTPGYKLDLGNNLANTKLALYNDGAFSYGFGVQGGEFRIHTGAATDKFDFLTSDSGSAVFSILNNNGNPLVGIGTSSPDVPLTFAPTTGDKVYLYDAGTNSDRYGFGVYANELRTFTGGGAANMTFGKQTGTTFTELMRLTNGGNLGIGTSSPSSRLAVSGGASVGADYNLAAPTNGLIVEGKVGIGSSSPTNTLSVAGSADFGTGYSPTGQTVRIAPSGQFTEVDLVSQSAGLALFTNPQATAQTSWLGPTLPAASGGIMNTVGGQDVVLSARNPAGGGVSIMGYHNGSSHDIKFFNDGVEQMRLTTGGLLGIGTTSPLARLDVAGANNGSAPLFQLSSVASFSTTTQFIVTNGGSVGIGTTSPMATFTVAGLGGGSQFINIAGTPGSFSSVTSGGLIHLTDYFGLNPYGLGVNNGGNFFIARGGQTNPDVVDMGGNIGIGTTTPQKLLHVYAGSAGGVGYSPRAKLVVENSGDVSLNILAPVNNLAAIDFGKSATPTNGQIVYNNANDSMLFAVGNALALTILNGGNVGIGTSSPYAKLSVHANNGDTNTTLFSVASSTASATTTLFTVLNNGNVGIGTSNPLSKLSIFGTGASGAAVFIENSRFLTFGLQGTSNDGGLGFISADSSNDFRFHTTGFSHPIIMDASVIELNANGATGNVGVATTTPWAQLSVNPNGISGPAFVVGSSTATKFIVANSGNVGIGTTSPGTVLTISGQGAAASAAQVTIDTVSGAAEGILLKKSGIEKVQLGLASAANNGVTGTAQDDAFIRSGGNLFFSAAAPATHMVITTSGNIGVGTSSPATTFSVSGNGYVTGGLGVGLVNTTAGTLQTSGAATLGGALTVSSGGAAITGAVTGASSYNGLVITANTGVITTGTWNGTTIAVANGGTGVTSSTGSGSVVLSTSPSLTTPNIGAASGSSLNLGSGAITSGLINGQTISSAANFTGTVAISGNTSLGGTNQRGLLDVNAASAGQIALYAFAANSAGTLPTVTNANGSSAFAITANTSAGQGELDLINANVGAAGGGGFWFQQLTGTGTTFITTMINDKAGNFGVKTLVAATANSLCYNTGITTLPGMNGIGTCSSDQRLKQNVASLDGSTALSQVMQLNPVSFNWNPTFSNDQQEQFGLLAQQVQQVWPNLVSTTSPTALTPDGTLSLNFNGLYAPIIASVQELNRRTSFIESATTSPILTVDASGNLGLGTTTPNHTLTVAGDVGAIAFVNTSTRSLKTDISYVDASTTEDMLTQLRSLKVATYRYTIENQNDPLRLGFIAEDAATIAPEILSPDQKGVDLYKLATFTLAGVQTLADKVDAQETRIASLEQRVSMLESGAVSSGGALSTSTIVNAIQSFAGVLNVNRLAANVFYAAQGFIDHLTAGNLTVGTPAAASGVTLYDTVTKQPYCFTVAGGVGTTTPGACGDANTNLNPFATSTRITTTNSSILSITLNGDNPTHIAVGGTYVEQGAVVSGGTNSDRTYDIYVNGGATATSSPWLDTSAPTTYILSYVTRDSAGNLATATRSVIVGNPDGTITAASAPQATTSSPVAPTASPTMTSTTTASSTSPTDTTASGTASTTNTTADTTSTSTTTTATSTASI